MIRPPLALLVQCGLVATLVLLGWRAYELSTIPVDLSKGAVTDTGDKAAVADQLNLPPGFPARRAFAEILARPVFQRTRRPAAVDVPAAIAPARTPAVQPPSPLELRLIGIVHADAVKVALVVEKGESEAIPLSVSETYRGWVLSELGSSFAVFESGSRTLVLEMTFRGDATLAPRAIEPEN